MQLQSLLCVIKQLRKIGKIRNRSEGATSCGKTWHPENHPQRFPKIFKDFSDLTIMYKEQKENWIAETFIRKYNKNTGKSYKILQRISEKIAPGPDFIIANSKNEQIGIEVTELLEDPSCDTGQQRHLETLFEQLLKSQLDKGKFKQWYFVFYNAKYPTNKEKLQGHVSRVVKQINTSYHELEIKTIDEKKTNFDVEGQEIRMGYNVSRNNGPLFLFFLYRKGGVQNTDREKFFEGLKNRIDEKNNKAQKYDKTHLNGLVIYDNTNYSVFLNDVKNEISAEIGLHSDEFKYIWLLTGSNVFKLN